MAKPKIVEVQWVDARSVYDAMSYANAKASIKLSERHTLGYIVEKTKEALLVSGTYDPSDEHDQEGGCDYTIIPRGWVKSIVELTPTGIEAKE